MDPFCPIILISAQESHVPLLKFQMAPRLKILMSSGSKKGTEIYFSFLSKSPAKRSSSKFPNRAPTDRDTRLQDFLHIETLIKIPLNNNFFLFSKALRKGRPSLFYKSGALRKQTPISRALLNVSFGVPSKGASLQVPFMESLQERCPVPGALLHSSFKVPGL